MEAIVRVRFARYRVRRDRVFRFTQLPLTGEKSQLLAVLLWYMWDSGAFNMISAFGLTLIAFLFVLSLILFRLQRRMAVAGEGF